MEISRNLPKKFGKTKYLENWFVNLSCLQSDSYLLLLHNNVRAFWINCSRLWDCLPEAFAEVFVLSLALTLGLWEFGKRKTLSSIFYSVPRMYWTTIEKCHVSLSQYYFKCTYFHKQRFQAPPMWAFCSEFNNRIRGEKSESSQLETVCCMHRKEFKLFLVFWINYRTYMSWGEIK